MPTPLAVHTEATRQAERLVRDPHLFKDVVMGLVFGVVLGWL
jgi:hypothetical protein